MKSRNAVVMGVAVALTFVVLFVAKINAQAPSAERQAIYDEMQAMLGVVPTFFKNVPDNSLKLEWELMKQVQMVPGAIPNKYRELIGVAVSAVSKCHYCAYFHTEFAKLNGATDAEIEDAIHYAKSSAGWSTWINATRWILTSSARKSIRSAPMCAHRRLRAASRYSDK